MKNLYLTIFLSFSLLASAQSWQWGKRGGSNNTIGSGKPEQVTAMVTDGQGNVYVLSPVGLSGLDVDGHPKQGFSDPANPIAPDQMIASFACDGTYRWSKVFGGWGGDHGYGMTADGEGNIYVSAMFGITYFGRPPNQIDEDHVFPQSESFQNTHKQGIYLFKYDGGGNLQWVKTPQPDEVFTGGIGYGYPIQLETDAAGNSWWWLYLNPGVYADGAYTVTTAGYHLFRYDADGDFLGAFPLDMQFGNNNVAAKMRRNPTSGTIYFIGTADPDFFLTATFGGQAVGHQLYVAAFDANGNFLWKKESTTNSLGANINDSMIDTDGSIYITGNGRQNMAYDGHVFTAATVHIFPYIMKLDSSGNLIWATNSSSVTSYSGGIGITRGAITGNYGGMTWDGMTITGAGQGYDVFLARFNPDNGAIIGLNGLPSDVGFVDHGTAVAKDPYGNFYVGGFFGHFLYVNGTTPLVNEGPETDFFVAKFGSENCTLSTPENAKPEIKAWPNPVKKYLHLENIESGSYFELYDAAGKKVGHGNIPDNHKIDMENYAPGLYLLRIKTANGEKAMRVIKG